MALVGIELETLVSEPDALTTRPPPCAVQCILLILKNISKMASSCVLMCTINT